MAGGKSLPPAKFPADRRDVITEVGESSTTQRRSQRPPRPCLCLRPRLPPPPPPRARVNLTLELAVLYEIARTHDNDPNVDIRKLRRLVSNRLASQNSRLRKWRRALDLEAEAEGLECLLKNLRPKVEALQRRMQLQQEENHLLRAAFDVRADQLQIAERVTEECEAEIMRLRELLANLNVNRDDGNVQNIPEDDEDSGLLNEDEEADKYLNLDDETMNLDPRPDL